MQAPGSGDGFWLRVGVKANVAVLAQKTVQEALTCHERPKAVLSRGEKVAGRPEAEADR